MPRTKKEVKKLKLIVYQFNCETDTCSSVSIFCNYRAERSKYDCFSTNNCCSNLEFLNDTLRFPLTALVDILILAIRHLSN